MCALSYYAGILLWTIIWNNHCVNQFVVLVVVYGFLYYFPLEVSRFPALCLSELTELSLTVRFVTERKPWWEPLAPTIIHRLHAWDLFPCVRWYPIYTMIHSIVRHLGIRIIGEIDMVCQNLQVFGNVLLGCVCVVIWI